MEDWLMELVEQKRRKAIEDENARPAPKDGRSWAELIYGRKTNAQPTGIGGDVSASAPLAVVGGVPKAIIGGAGVMWTAHGDGDFTVTPEPFSQKPQGASGVVASVPPASGPLENNQLNGASSHGASTTTHRNNGEPARPPAAKRHIFRNPGEQDSGRITLINDENNGRVLDREIDYKLAGLIEAYVAEYGRSVNVNSTVRDRAGEKKSSPHYSGHGVDVNRIDGKRVKPGEPLVTPLLFGAAFSLLSEAGRGLSMFLFVASFTAFATYGATFFLLLPSLAALRLVARPGWSAFAALGAGLAGVVFFAFAVVSWRASGPDSGPPVEPFSEFLVRWAADPFSLLFPMAGLLTALFYRLLLGPEPTTAGRRILKMTDSGLCFLP